MSEVTIFHNPNCSTSKYAVGVADELGVDYDVVKYMLKAERPTREQLEDLVAKLEDPTTDLVRRDANFTKLGLTDADVDTPEQVIDILVQHPALLQRPILVKGDVAIIGRPKDRVPAFLGA
jgi:arsenate reductase (glutaredoxin)